MELFSGRKKEDLVFMLILILVISGVGVLVYYRGQPAFLNTEAGKLNIFEASPPVEEDGKQLLVVHVAGAVKRPGVYRLPEGSRVVDAVKSAGGVSPEGDLERLNLAAMLTDGQKIIIPRIIHEEELPFPSPGAARREQELQGRLININTAGNSELQTLPGIGPSRAEEIIRYRQEKGGFQKIEDLMKIPGIGPKTFQKLKGRITVY